MNELLFCYIATPAMLFWISVFRFGWPKIYSYSELCSIVGSLVLWPVTLTREIHAWNQQRRWERASREMDDDA